MRSRQRPLGPRGVKVAIRRLHGVRVARRQRPRGAERKCRVHQVALNAAVATNAARMPHLMSRDLSDVVEGFPICLHLNVGAHQVRARIAVGRQPDFVIAEAVNEFEGDVGFVGRPNPNDIEGRLNVLQPGRDPRNRGVFPLLRPSAALQDVELDRNGGPLQKPLQIVHVVRSEIAAATAATAAATVANVDGNAITNRDANVDGNTITNPNGHAGYHRHPDPRRHAGNDQYRYADRNRHATTNASASHTGEPISACVL